MGMCTLQDVLLLMFPLLAQVEAEFLCVLLGTLSVI